MQLRRDAGMVLAVVGLLLVAVATLTPLDDPHEATLATSLFCLVCGDHGGADVACNLFLFVPFAVGLRLSGQSWVRTVALAAATSFTVELLQLRVVPGRDASLSDLLSNTLSGAVGATLGPLLVRSVTPTPGRALGLVAGGITVWLGVLAASAWLLAPEVPRGELMSRWAHEAPGSDVFGGRVREVHLDGRPMPRNSSPPDSSAARRRLDGGEFSLEAEVVSGAPVRDQSWIYMFRVPSGEALTLSQRRRQAVISLPARALRFRLRPPTLTLPDAFPRVPGVPVRLTASKAGGRVRLTSAYEGAQRSVGLAISPAYGWILLAPFELAAGTGVHWVTGLWVAALLLPIGYWGRWTTRPALLLGMLATALVAGLAVLPALAGFPPVHWSEWSAGMLGAAAGWALQGPAAYLQGRCASPSDSEFSSS